MPGSCYSCLCHPCSDTLTNRHSAQEEIKNNIPFIIGTTGLKNSLKSSRIVLFLELLRGWKLLESCAPPLLPPLAYNGRGGGGVGTGGLFWINFMYFIFLKNCIFYFDFSSSYIFLILRLYIVIFFFYPMPTLLGTCSYHIQKSE